MLFRSSLRQRLRQQEGAARKGAIGVRCVFSRENVRMPDGPASECDIEGNLNCHGYGSTVSVTASFGFAAAGEVVQQWLNPRLRAAEKQPL